MADKKKNAQAEKAVAAQKSTKKPTADKVVPDEKVTVNPGVKERNIPIRLITSVTFLGLFILFLVVFFNPKGVIPSAMHNLILGFIGKAGFAVSIPGLLYLFIVHAFSGGRPIKMRSICIGAFIVICGCISHLVMMPRGAAEGFPLISELYNGGIEGTTGGILCGGVASLIFFFFNDPLSYILLIIAAVFTLLGAMQITVISIIRAVQNRPRSELEEEHEERPEPATLVVNHIANKRIARLEQKHEQKTRQQEEESPTDPTRKKCAPEKGPEKFADIMRQIDSETDIPVSAAGEYIPAPEEEPEIPLQETPKVSKSKMPPLEIGTDSEETEPKEPEPVEKPVPAPHRVKPAKVKNKETKVPAEEVAENAEEEESLQKPAYSFPPIELLKLPASGVTDGTAEMRENTRRLNETLASFRIEAHIINVTRGPSVTRYEVELEKGVRLNKLTTAADDIALSLGAVGVRIAAIPGKISVVGIEVPNRAVNTVSLREVIDSQEFSKAKSKSSFAVGKDIGGSCIVGNIAKLPHMLIAGTTGSGKSVCMNSIIISLLYKASPDDVKLIMVDPKMVELGIYNGIPHLLIPVVTDPKKAAGSLQWAVSEMMRRYKAMSDAGVRDLESYNSIVESQETEGTTFPQVVVIIDELADLMLVAAKEVEESICRIAQMGRAAGIHLIIATQRPSADVITGLMKANIPSRIAFAVASAMESRIILDTQGAEKLVGKGDMLYAPIGNGKPKRVQGCFVSDAEVEAVASYVKANFVTDYDQNIMEEIERKAVQTGNKPTASDPEPNPDELGGDEMLPAAVDVILEAGLASVSMLQRRLKLGYARAARIVDEMEEKGIVGPFQGSKPREILVTKEQWAAMKAGGAKQLGFEDLDEPGESEETDDFTDPDDF